jgi:hypothetical protein
MGYAGDLQRSNGTSVALYLAQKVSSSNPCVCCPVQSEYYIQAHAFLAKSSVTKAFLCRRWLGTGRSKGENAFQPHTAVPNFDQGQWTQAEQALLANSNLNAIGHRHNLDSCVILSIKVLRAETTESMN